MKTYWSEYSAIDLFSGAGGLSLGLQSAGFNVRCAVDNDKAAAETYSKNFQHPILCQSIKGLSGASLLSVAGLKRGECFLVAGGPPCQGFSVQRRGSDKDERNSLIFEFIRIVLEIRPAYFLMENVPGIRHKRGIELLTRVIEKAESSGYKCRIQKVNAVEFGVPQIRQRIFVVGELLTLGKPNYEFPKPVITDPSRYMTVRQALKGLPAAFNKSENGPPYNHISDKLSARNLERIASIPEGGGRSNLPTDLQLACHVNNKTHRHLDVYGRLAWDKPSVTLTARFDSFTRGSFGHPTENRTITLREGARIQTFPDAFRFYGTKVEVARQIGNGVPPKLANAMGKSILSSWIKKSSPSLQSHTKEENPLQLTLI